MNKDEERVGKKHGITAANTRLAIEHVVNGYLTDKQIVRETKKFPIKFLKALTKAMGYKVSRLKENSLKVT